MKRWQISKRKRVQKRVINFCRFTQPVPPKCRECKRQENLQSLKVFYLRKQLSILEFCTDKNHGKLFSKSLEQADHSLSTVSISLTTSLSLFVYLLFSLLFSLSLSSDCPKDLFINLRWIIADYCALEKCHKVASII